LVASQAIALGSRHPTVVAPHAVPSIPTDKRREMYLKVKTMIAGVKIGAGD